jgi:hypothetical protein
VAAALAQMRAALRQLEADHAELGQALAHLEQLLSMK